MRLVQRPNDFIAAARTNATRPFMGRVVLIDVAGFHDESLEEIGCSLERIRMRRGGL